MIISENGVDREMTQEEEEAFLASLGQPPRRLLPKPVVIHRLNEQGKLAAALEYLQANPLAYALWFMPGHGEVYEDDEGLLTALTAIGADIEATTAPV